MTGRTESATYRYGFGGHEKDNEIKGSGNHLSFGDYGYDPRLGRRWNVDPMANEMPGTSPYSYAYNNPILLKDPDGKLPILPFLIKAGAAGATDMFLQVGMNFLLDDDVETIGQAFEKVDWVDVSISAAQGALPWSVPGGKFGKAASAATRDVIINASRAAINGEDYSINDATSDFFVGFFSQLTAEGVEDFLSSRKTRQKLGALLGQEKLDQIVLLLPKSMTPELDKYKAAAENGDLIQTITKGTRSNSRKIWTDSNGPVPDGYDVDHIIQRQHGGTDALDNLQLKKSGQNRSEGPKAYHLNKQNPVGTKYKEVKIDEK
jgi:RHS repeat-associated protein